MEKSVVGEGSEINKSTSVGKDTIVGSGIVVGDIGKKRKWLLVSLAATVVLVVGLGGYFVYRLTNAEKSKEDAPKVVDNSEDEKDDILEDNERKRDGVLSINSALVKNLVYPSANQGAEGREMWSYRDIDLDNYGRDFMMISATYVIKGRWSAIEVEKSFRKIFGPDVEYRNGDFDSGDPCGLTSYDASSSVYWEEEQACGGQEAWDWHNEVRLYKAKQGEDEIYTYFYVQPFLWPNFANDDFSAPLVCLYNREVDKYSSNGFFDEKSNPKNCVKNVVQDKLKVTIKTMMDKGEVDTYKFTFKKQSDGKYYFYSGAWE